MKRTVNTITLWMAVHCWRSGLLLLGISAGLSIATASVVITQLGPLQMVAPISPQQLIAVLAALGVAVACHAPTRSGLPDPARAKAARLVWLLAWSAAAYAAVQVGQLLGSEANGAAVGRNLLLFSALALVALVYVGPSAMVIPVLLYLMVALTYPSSGHDSGFGWWALALKPTASWPELLTVAGLWLAVVVRYVARRAR